MLLICSPVWISLRLGEWWGRQKKKNPNQHSYWFPYTLKFPYKEKTLIFGIFPATFCFVLFILIASFILLSFPNFSSCCSTYANNLFVKFLWVVEFLSPGMDETISISFQISIILTLCVHILVESYFPSAKIFYRFLASEFDNEVYDFFCTSLFSFWNPSMGSV